MFQVILFTALIVGLIFLYMHRKFRRGKAADIDSVRDYHAAYDRLRSHQDVRSKQSDYKPYVTKYNSSEDYRER